MFQRIRNKLFLVLVGANALLVLFIYLATSWSFDRQFRDYVVHQDDPKLDALVQALAEGYSLAGNWDWIRNDRHRWFALMRRHLASGNGAMPSVFSDGPPDGPEDRRPPPRIDSTRAEFHEHGDVLPRKPGSTDRQSPGDADRDGPMRPRPGPPRAPGPPPSNSLTLSAAMFLLDDKGRILEGPGGDSKPTEVKAIKAGGSTVGYLGFTRRTELVDAVDLVFAREQNRNFLYLALAMLSTSIVLAAGIAHYLAKPIRQLARGTTALTKGRYQVRVPVRGRDELAQLALHFNALAQTLEANRTARQQWIADIAHELRTPLSRLQGEMEAMQDGIRALTPRSLVSLMEEVTALSRLVDDLHTLSLSDLGALSYHKDVLDLGQLLKATLERHRTALMVAGIESRVAGAGEDDGEVDSWILGDADRLSQMLVNLIENTRRYTDAPGNLIVELHREDSCVILDWKDSSPGVSSEDLPLLTQHLFRVDESRNRASGGSGLGLTIVKAIVEAHEGSIEARHSELGGLWWHIVFPACQPSAEEA